MSFTSETMSSRVLSVVLERVLKYWLKLSNMWLQISISNKQSWERRDRIQWTPCIMGFVCCFFARSIWKPQKLWFWNPKKIVVGLFRPIRAHFSFLSFPVFFYNFLFKIIINKDVKMTVFLWEGGELICMFITITFILKRMSKLQNEAN